MKRVEKAVKAEIAAWGAGLAGSALAEAALLLARRLDADPADREVTALSRELRLVLAELRRLAGATESELEVFLAGLSAAALR